VSIDFFTVPMTTFRVLFVRVMRFNVTEHPTAAWTTQQIIEAFPDESIPSASGRNA
jgi:putative transposase